MLLDFNLAGGELTYRLELSVRTSSVLRSRFLLPSTCVRTGNVYLHGLQFICKGSILTRIKQVFQQEMASGVQAGFSEFPRNDERPEANMHSQSEAVTEVCHWVFGHTPSTMLTGSSQCCYPLGHTSIALTKGMYKEEQEDDMEPVETKQHIFKL